MTHQNVLSEKLSKVPSHVQMKFFNELSKAKSVMDKKILNLPKEKSHIEREYMAMVYKNQLIMRYKQLIRLHLKKYGITSL